HAGRRHGWPVLARRSRAPDHSRARDAATVDPAHDCHLGALSKRGLDADQDRASAADGCAMRPTGRSPWQDPSPTTAGFTLIEALIAMAMMAMILTARATLTRQWLPNWNRGLTRVQRSEHLALALERIAADLAAAQFVPKMAGGRAPYFDGTEHAVTL